MANAATIAGLAFSNAFVGVNHALAHAVGARFGIAHGRANAIFLPHVLRYNASLPTQVHARAGLHGLRRAGEVRADRRGSSASAGKAEEERRERLFERVDELLDAVEHAALARARPACPRDEFEAALPDLARAAFMDPSIRTNPRIPLVGELVELLRRGYEGRPETSVRHFDHG